MNGFPSLISSSIVSPIFNHCQGYETSNRYITGNLPGLPAFKGLKEII